MAIPSTNARVERNDSTPSFATIWKKRYFNDSATQKESMMIRCAIAVKGMACRNCWASALNFCWIEKNIGKDIARGTVILAPRFLWRRQWRIFIPACFEHCSSLFAPFTILSPTNPRNDEAAMSPPPHFPPILLPMGQSMDFGVALAPLPAWSSIPANPRPLSSWQISLYAVSISRSSTHKFRLGATTPSWPSFPYKN